MKSVCLKCSDYSVHEAATEWRKNVFHAYSSCAVKEEKPKIDFLNSGATSLLTPRQETGHECESITESWGGTVVTVIVASQESGDSPSSGCGWLGPGLMSPNKLTSFAQFFFLRVCLNNLRGKVSAKKPRGKWHLFLYPWCLKAWDLPSYSIFTLKKLGPSIDPLATSNINTD